jgi:hypothetical protein
MLPLTRSRGRQRFFGGGWNPFSQLGPTLDLSFAGVVTDLTDPNGYTLNTNFIAPQYQIAAQYVVWETNVGLVDKTFSQIITFTRASTGTFFDSTGTLQSAAIDAPRLDYNPSTLAAQGLLIEESRTNSIRNNTMVGAVAGTPGTLPTNWAIAGSGLGTLTQTVVGTGTSNGITYIDVKFSGTTSTTGFNIAFETATQIAALSGQTWTQSAFFALVGGSITNINNLRFQTEGRDSGGATVESFAGSDAKSTLTASLQRLSFSATLASASTAYVRPVFSVNFASGVAIDITLRIGLPQLEQGAFATSVIPTTTTALTRADDVASVNTLSPWFNASAGTIYVESVLAGDAVNKDAISIDDGTSNNTIQIRWSSGALAQAAVTVGGVNQASIAPAGYSTVGTVYKRAFAFAVNDFQQVINGTSVGIDTSGSLPTVTTMRLSSVASLGQMCGYFRRMTFYPRRMAQAEMITITT